MMQINLINFFDKKMNPKVWKYWKKLVSYILKRYNEHRNELKTNRKLKKYTTIHKKEESRQTLLKRKECKEQRYNQIETSGKNSSDTGGCRFLWMQVFVIGTKLLSGIWSNRFIFFFEFFMVFAVFKKFSMTVNKQIKGSEIFSESETSKNKRREAGEKERVNQPIQKKWIMAE